MTDGLAGCMRCIKCGLLITKGTWRTDGSGPYCDDHIYSNDHVNMLQMQNQLMLEELCKIKNCQAAEYHFTLSEAESVNLLKDKLTKALQEKAVALKALRTAINDLVFYKCAGKEDSCDDCAICVDIKSMVNEALEEAAEELENEQT